MLIPSLENTRFVRAAVFLIIAVLAAGGGTCLYYRQKADKLADRALDVLPLNPTRAYDVLKPINDINDKITLGVVSQSNREFEEKLNALVLKGLKIAVPPPEAFNFALESLHALRSIELNTGNDRTAQKLAILEGARDRIEAVKERGTLSGWDAMINLFEMTRKLALVGTVSFEPSPEWLTRARMERTRRPFGLRDTRNKISENMRVGLKYVGLTATPVEGPMVTPCDVALTDLQLTTAEGYFIAALRNIDDFMRAFEEEKIPEELVELMGKLRFSRATLHLCHRLDRGEALAQLGSTAIVNKFIDTNSDAFPSNVELYGAFQNETLNEFAAAANAFSMDKTLDPSLRASYEALACWNRAWFASLNGFPDPDDLDRFQALVAKAEVGVGAGILEAVRARKEPLMIVQIP